MNKQNAIKAIREYRDFYTDTAKKISLIRADRTRTAEWKAEQIAKLTSDFNARNTEQRNLVRASIENVKADLASRRQDAIRKGLEAAEAVNMIIGGIRDNSYSADMLDDIINVYENNPVALQRIKGALLSNEAEDMRIIGAGIRQDNSDRIMNNLNKISNSLENIPAVDADPSKDWNAGLYQNGTSFDGWAAYISENVD